MSLRQQTRKEEVPFDSYFSVELENSFENVEENDSREVYYKDI